MVILHQNTSRAGMGWGQRRESLKCRSDLSVAVVGVWCNNNGVIYFFIVLIIFRVCVHVCVCARACATLIRCLKKAY